jgi:GNAT superfamily N-acetyltransferase
MAQNRLRSTRFNRPDPKMLDALLLLRAEFDDADSPEPFINFITRQLEGESMLLILAWAGDTPAGYALAFDVAEHPYMPEWTRAGYISQFLVSQGYRRHGVGRLLMEHVNTWFDSRGVAKVLLNVDIDNESGIRFWKNNGFTPYATRMRRLNK